MSVLLVGLWLSAAWIALSVLTLIGRVGKPSRGPITGTVAVISVVIWSLVLVTLLGAIEAVS